MDYIAFRDWNFKEITCLLVWNLWILKEKKSSGRRIGAVMGWHLRKSLLATEWKSLHLLQPSLHVNEARTKQSQGKKHLRRRRYGISYAKVCWYLIAKNQVLYKLLENANRVYMTEDKFPAPKKECMKHSYRIPHWGTKDPLINYLLPGFVTIFVLI